MIEKTHSTKQRLIDIGLPMLLQHGYNDLGIQALLAATGIPKGSFYHHFRDKQDFALQVVDAYIARGPRGPRRKPRGRGVGRRWRGCAGSSR